jgi:peptidoglycan hydrolase CwlO-like protein
MKIALKKTKITKLPLKMVLILTALVVAAVVPMQIWHLNNNAYACGSVESCQSKIDAYQHDIDSYTAQAQVLAGQADTLKNKIDTLNIQISAAQSEIDLSQASYDKLVQQITDTENQIKNDQDALGVTIANIYVGDNITPIEMLASSKSIGDYLDKQEYRSSVRSELSKTIANIKTLKDELNKQKDEVKVVLDRQKAQQESLNAMKNEQQSILDKTNNDESAYQSLISIAKAALADAAATQRTYFSNHDINNGVYGSFVWANFSGNFGCGSDGYPYCGVQDSYSDPWALYNRECVSYVAWALHDRFGKYVGSFSGNGMAYEWVWSAPLYSDAYRVDDPQAGDAVVLPVTPGFADVGHLMIVESVNGDWVHVSQYNFNSTGEYSTMDIKTTGVVFLRFHDR